MIPPEELKRCDLGEYSTRGIPVLPGFPEASENNTLSLLEHEAVYIHAGPRLDCYVDEPLRNINIKDEGRQYLK